jgi:hypothetical protein
MPLLFQYDVFELNFLSGCPNIGVHRHRTDLDYFVATALRICQDDLILLLNPIKKEE